MFNLFKCHIITQWLLLFLYLNRYAECESRLRNQPFLTIIENGYTQQSVLVVIIKQHYGPTKMFSTTLKVRTAICLCIHNYLKIYFNRLSPLNHTRVVQYRLRTLIDGRQPRNSVSP